MAEFTHLHLHTQYSLLDGAIRVKDLFPKVHELGMDSVAVTDHGNMFGAIDLYSEAKAAGVKLIFGCETYVAPDRLDKTERRRNHLILLAKNEVGYKNLWYLNSMGYLEGFYYNPRIDKQLLREHSEGLIGLSACLGGEIAQTLEKNGVAAAEESAKEYATCSAGRLLPRAAAERPRRAGDAQRRAHRMTQEDRHPARRDERLPLRQPERRARARHPDGVQQARASRTRSGSSTSSTATT